MKTELRKIPGVGKATEEDLIRLGYPTIESLKSADPEELYRRDCEITGTLIDRCQLYVYRCAVYFAKTEHPATQNSQAMTALSTNALDAYWRARNA